MLSHEATFEHNCFKSVTASDQFANKAKKAVASNFPESLKKKKQKRKKERKKEKKVKLEKFTCFDPHCLNPAHGVPLSSTVTNPLQGVT
jgi:hypothetical protein